MDESLLAYIQKLEVIFFFSGYPLLYALIVSIAGNKLPGKNLPATLARLLPYSYALTGTAYLGLLLRNLYYQSPEPVTEGILQSPLLVIWGLLSLLCWIPAIAKRKIGSLLHSMFFLLLIIKDMFLNKPGNQQPVNDHLHNDMMVYTGSLILNIVSLSLTYITYLLFLRLLSRKSTQRS